MKPIWYFVGLILLIIGGLILISGILNLTSPTDHVSVLSELHPNIWWGSIMIVVGLIYVIKNKNVKVE